MHSSLTFCVLCCTRHNTIHFLYPPAKPSPALNTATLINPRITNEYLCQGHALNDTNENEQTLDRWYGATSPMMNLDVGKDTINCYAVNSNAQRFGGPLVVESAILVTDPVRTNRTVSNALMNALARPPSNLRFALSWCSIEVSMPFYGQAVRVSVSQLLHRHAVHSHILSWRPAIRFGT